MTDNNSPPPNRQFREFVFGPPPETPEPVLNIAQKLHDQESGLIQISAAGTDERFSAINKDALRAGDQKFLNFFSSEKREQFMTSFRKALNGGQHAAHFINIIPMPDDLTLLSGGILMLELKERLSFDEMQDILFINFLAKTPDIHHKQLEKIDPELFSFIEQYRDMTRMDDKPAQIRAIQDMAEPNRLVFQSTMIALLTMAVETKKAPAKTLVQFAQDLIDITSTRRMDRELTMTTVRLFNELSLTTSAEVLVGMADNGTVHFTRPPKNPQHGQKPPAGPSPR